MPSANNASAVIAAWYHASLPCCTINVFAHAQMCRSGVIGIYDHASICPTLPPSRLQSFCMTRRQIVVTDKMPPFGYDQRYRLTYRSCVVLELEYAPDEIHRSVGRSVAPARHAPLSGSLWRKGARLCKCRPILERLPRTVAHAVLRHTISGHRHPTREWGCIETIAQQGLWQQRWQRS